MRVLQLVLLGLFGLCVALSILFRLRMAAAGSKIDHGDASPERKAAADRYYRFAVRFSITAFGFLVLAIAVGAILVH